MSIEKLKRVLWRLKEIEPAGTYTERQVRLAIMEECGTDERTIQRNREHMIELKLLIPAEFGKLKTNETRKEGE